MRRVVYSGRADLLAWAEAQLPGCKFRDDAQAIGLADDGGLLAVVTFDTFSVTYCHVGIAAVPGRRWMTREFCRHVAAYAFITCGFPRITGLISEHNADSLRFARHLGFVKEGEMREAGLNGENQLVFGLLRRDCQWLPKTIAPQARQVGRQTV